VTPAARPATRALLEGPIVARSCGSRRQTCWSMFVQASVGLIETLFRRQLGTDALAGVALVFPVLMLTQMMSAGPWGRDLGRDRPRARRRTSATTPMRWRCTRSPSRWFGLLLRWPCWGRPLVYSVMGGAAAFPRGGADLRMWSFRRHSDRSSTRWQRDPRHRQWRSRRGHRCGRRGTDPAVSLLIFGWGPVPPLGVRRWRRSR